MPDERVVDWELEYFEEDVECVDAVIVALWGAAALRLRTDRCLVLVVQAVFEGEAEWARLSHHEESDAGRHVHELDDVDWHSGTVGLRS